MKYKKILVFAAILFPLSLASCSLTKYTKIDEIPSTCTEAGVKEHYVDKNGKLYIFDDKGNYIEVLFEDLILPLAEHSYGPWKVVVKSTEEEEGLRERTCKVCSYVDAETTNKLAHVHKFEDKYSCDVDYHWRASTCGHDVVEDKSLHEFYENKCSICGYLKNSEGLQYSEVEGGLEVVGIGTCTDKNLIIPESVNGLAVVGIGKSAFASNSIFEHLNLPDSLTYIEDESFISCRRLKDITFGKNIAVIGKFAFDSCSKISALSIPGSVKEISECAFSKCTSIQTLTLNDGLETIGSLAFNQCEKITEVIIPKSVNNIKSAVFSRCNNLSKINVDSANETYYSINNANVIIERETNTLIAGCKTSKIPNNVTSIGDSAFYCCENLDTINIPSSVVSIGESAFGGCNFSAISIPNSVKEIKSFAFQSCSFLTKIIIPDSVSRVEDGLFFGCPNLQDVTLPNNLDYLGSSVFCRCKNLETIAIPDGIKVLHSNLFAECANLKTVSIPISVERIDTSVFEECISLENISLPEGLKILTNSFYRSGLKSFELPSTVEDFSSSCFNGCNSLKTMTVKAGNKRYDSRNNCNAIIETKTNLLVSGCSTTIIPDTVLGIEQVAFGEMDSLENILIPSSVISIKDNSFYKCSNIKSIKVDDANSVYDSRNNCNAIIETKSNMLIKGTYTTVIPDTVTVIGSFSFFGTSTLKSITIPSNIVKICEAAFNSCANLESIVYKGTMEQWKSLEKEWAWNFETGEYVVHCIDGDLAKE